MYYSKRQILDALYIIKNICKGTNSCAFCPFGTKSENCMIRFSITAPDGWKIGEEGEDVWRAFEIKEDE